MRLEPGGGGRVHVELDGRHLPGLLQEPGVLDLTLGVPGGLGLDLALRDLLQLALVPEPGLLEVEVGLIPVVGWLVVDARDQGLGGFMCAEPRWP